MPFSKKSKIVKKPNRVFDMPDLSYSSLFVAVLKYRHEQVGL